MKFFLHRTIKTFFLVGCVLALSAGMFAGSGWSSSPTTSAAPRPVVAPAVCLYQFLKDDKGNPIAQPRYLVIVQGDLVRQTFHDAASSVIVNPANAHMLGGEGVDRTVHDAAGDALRKECERLPTTAGKARARAGDAFLLHQAGHLATDVIAAVGPDCRFDSQYDQREALMRQVVDSVLTVADERKYAVGGGEVRGLVREVAWSGISEGAFLYEPSFAVAARYRGMATYFAARSASTVLVCRDVRSSAYMFSIAVQQANTLCAAGILGHVELSDNNWQSIVYAGALERRG